MMSNESHTEMRMENGVAQSHPMFLTGSLSGLPTRDPDNNTSNMVSADGFSTRLNYQT